MERGLVLLSGGLDSTTVLYMARERGLTLFALSFNYGQRHSVELEKAQSLANRLCEKHFVLNLDPAIFKNTALVPGGPEVPMDAVSNSGIPVTYVPARNILFLAHALALAESYEISHVFLGVNALDYSGYPDCRPEFLEAFSRMANLGMKRGVEGKPIEIHAPLIRMSKAQIIQEGMRLGVDYRQTSSCYKPLSHGRPCGHCDSCLLRKKGFDDAGLTDPLVAP
ncbi:MAG: 7-cyano-7-deazaguanine synthase QueC [Leptospirales bacterium]|nr:7-cyano-7-deazaguanine synthase QueC [Leptospirales bacterium]